MRKPVLLILVIVSAVTLMGCGSKDVDPGAKIDAPGYYNGPMEPRGGGQGAGGEGAKTAPDDPAAK